MHEPSKYQTKYKIIGSQANENEHLRKNRKKKNWILLILSLFNLIISKATTIFHLTKVPNENDNIDTSYSD